MSHESHPDLSHALRDGAKEKESALGAETEIWRELAGNPDMAKVITSVKVPNHGQTLAGGDDLNANKSNSDCGPCRKHAQQKATHLAPHSMKILAKRGR